jgi:hypothetical protein
MTVSERVVHPVSRSEVEVWTLTPTPLQRSPRPA